MKKNYQKWRKNNMEFDRLTFEIKYLDILKKQINEGLEILSGLKISDANYKDVVVNLNNANNIALQLEHDIVELTKENTNDKEA